MKQTPKDFMCNLYTSRDDQLIIAHVIYEEELEKEGLEVQKNVAL